MQTPESSDAPALQISPFSQSFDDKEASVGVHMHLLETGSSEPGEQGSIFESE